MIETDLDRQFNEAFVAASKMMPTSLPPDVQLRLYAFYKQATFGSAQYNQSDSFDLRNAFKTNAWMQISHLSVDESKEQYIEIVNSLLKK